MKRSHITWVLTALILAVLFLMVCPPVSAQSQFEMNSKVCVNGHCTFTGTGHPGHSWYYPDPYDGRYGTYPDYPNQYIPAPDYRYYCSPYRTARYQGYLSAGQYRVYGFKIGGDRTYIEWILNGGCGTGSTPVMMSMGTDQVYSWRHHTCGADFDIYVYQNRYPCSSCRADRWDTGISSNAYVGWNNPCPGCYYSVVVYCKSGSGYYDLTSNSYVNNCWYPYDSSGPVMLSSVEQAMSAGSDNILMLSNSGGFNPSEIIWDEGSQGDYPGGIQPGSGDGGWQPPAE